MRGEMKFMKKSQTYKSSNVEFSPSSFVATSYQWWTFVMLINGKVVFNSHRYSPSTGKHQSKVRSLLNTLGIKIDLEVDTRLSLCKSDALENSIKVVETEIQELRDILANSRRKKALDEERQAMIANKLEHIKKIERVMAGSKLQAVMK